MKFNIFRPIKSVNYTLRENRIGYIALGFVLGMFLGLLPFGFNSAIILILIFALRNDLLAVILSAVLFSFLGFLIDPLAHSLGLVVLQAGFLQGLWTFLYNLPLVPFTGFNNTLVMGNGLIGIILTAPAGFLVQFLILKYRSLKKPAKQPVVIPVESPVLEPPVREEIKEVPAEKPAEISTENPAENPQ